MSKFTQFVANEVINLSIGYFAGLTASMLVSRFFVKRGFANLWGIAAKKEALQKDNYEWLMFFASYFIGLLVMVGVNYALKQMRSNQTV